MVSDPSGAFVAGATVTLNHLGNETKLNDDTVPGATVVLEGPVQTDPRTVVTDGNGFFEFKDVEPGTTYHVTVSARGSPTGPRPPSSSSQASTQS